MPRSVRARLTYWYTGIFGMVLVAFSLVVYGTLSRDAYGDVDASLSTAIDALSRSLRHEIEEHEGKKPGEDSFRGVVATVYRDSFPEVAVAVLDGTGKIAEKPAAGGRLTRFAGQGKRGYRTDGIWRSEAVTVSVPAAGQYTFEAETSLAEVDSEMRTLRVVFFTAIPITLVLAVLAGYVLARKSLAPVVAMSSAVEKMSAQDLSRRVAVANERDELGTLATTFNRLLDKVERAFESQKQFMADSSHELQTPIYVARTATDVLLSAEGRSEEEYRDALKTIQQQLRRLSHLVEGMFLLAQADAGAYPVKAEDFYLDEVISECLRAARVLAQNKLIEVTGPELAEMPCHGDEGLIRQLILILLDNAVKYTPNGGHVALRASCLEADQYVLEVSDSGRGIGEDAKKLIFTRFFRADRTHSRVPGERSPGAGLGLAIGHWIAAAHGGSVTLVESSPQGSTFRVYLPSKAPAMGIPARNVQLR